MSRLTVLQQPQKNARCEESDAPTPLPKNSVAKVFPTSITCSAQVPLTRNPGCICQVRNLLSNRTTQWIDDPPSISERPTLRHRWQPMQRSLMQASGTLSRHYKACLLAIMHGSETARLTMMRCHSHLDIQQVMRITPREEKVWPIQYLRSKTRPVQAYCI